jgi:hypothetical protein
MSSRLGNVFSLSTPSLCWFRSLLIIYLIRYELGIPQTADGRSKTFLVQHEHIFKIIE